MDVNYFGTLRVLKAALPSMVGRREGEVVLISSAAAVCGALCRGHCVLAIYPAWNTSTRTC